MKIAYSVKELICELGVGRSKIYREIKTGNLVAHKIGKKTVFLAESVKAYVDSLPQAPAE